MQPQLRSALGTLSTGALFIFAAFIASAAALPLVPPTSHPVDQEIAAQTLRQQIEEDWLHQAAALHNGAGAVTTESDARGGCDGVKNGKYAFHTAQEPNPWWQVDLGETTAVHRVVVFNRLDYAPGLHNADRLRFLTSLDGKSWKLRHENKNKHFGGITGAAPLEVKFQPPVQARFLRLQIPSAEPIYLHLDEVEVYGTRLEQTGGKDGANSETNLALYRPAKQSSLSQWSTAKPLGNSKAPREFPTHEAIARGRKLIAELTSAGVDCRTVQARLDQAARKLAETPNNSPEDVRRSLYLQTRWIVRELAFSNPAFDMERLLFVKRFTQETYPDVCLNHMPWVSRPGGDICILSGKGQRLLSSLVAPSEPIKLTRVLNNALGPGHVHGIDLSWAADRIVFGYARAATNRPPEGWLDRAHSYHLRRTVEPIHIFEVGTSGANLRQVTEGEWSDLDPTYAPNGDIIFVSERCGTSLQCNEYDKDETSCNLYVMKPDGSGIRRMSVNKDGDYLPHALDDGTIAYTRWEYHERSWAFIQSIWTIRPDGTGADAIFKQHFVNPWALEDTRSIPGSKKLVAIAAGHHTLAVGPLVVVDPSTGINEPKGIQIVTPDVKPTEGGMDGIPVLEGGTRDGGGLYTTPWALSEKCFLTAYTYSNKETDATGYALYFIDVFGNKELIFRDPTISCFTPVPLQPRRLPPVFPDSVDLTKPNATCVISDASFGSEEIAGRIRYVRIAEPIGWPYDNQLGGQRYGEKGPKLINWTPIRILGDVPVLKDGSAHFEVPPDTAVYFQLLDENRMELRRMRSFISFQPGEHRACAGCHETRGIAPRPTNSPLAASQPPQALLPPPWGNRPISFLRDIQPILDRNCVECHSGLKPAGGLDFCGGLTDWSRQTERMWGLVPGYGFNRAFETINKARLVATAEPNLQDASITQPLTYGAHASKLFQTLQQTNHRARVQLQPEERLQLAIWMDANAPYHDRFVNKRAKEKAYDLAADRELEQQIRTVHQQRCAQCHAPAEVTRLDWIDLRSPARTLFLRAPLRKSSGGSQTCSGLVYRDTNDPDYQKLRGLLNTAVSKAWAFPRRDLLPLKEANATQ